MIEHFYANKYYISYVHNNLFDISLFLLIFQLQIMTPKKLLVLRVD